MFNELGGLFSSTNPTGFDFADLLSKHVAQSSFQSTAKDSDDYDWKEAYLSLKEDFDSYRKRTENARRMEKTNLTREIIKGFLGVIDYILFTYKAKNSMGTYTKEDEMVLNKLTDLLKSYNVYPMKDPVGQMFDHRWHEAVIADHSDMFESGTITMVIAHGYMIGDEVLRHAKVAVAR